MKERKKKKKKKKEKEKRKKKKEKRKRKKKKKKGEKCPVSTQDEFSAKKRDAKCAPSVEPFLTRLYLIQGNQLMTSLDPRPLPPLPDQG